MRSRVSAFFVCGGEEVFTTYVRVDERVLRTWMDVKKHRARAETWIGTERLDMIIKEFQGDDSSDTSLKAHERKEPFGNLSGGVGLTIARLNRGSGNVVYSLDGLILVVTYTFIRPNFSWPPYKLEMYHDGSESSKLVLPYRADSSPEVLDELPRDFAPEIEQFCRSIEART